MADGGPLERQDLVSDDALKAPGILTEEFQKLLDKLDDVVKKSQEYGNSFSTADASTAKLKESTAGLSDEQRVLGQITTQINTLIAKQSDEYIEQVGVLNNLKQATKDKTALGEQEAQSITKENASRNQLMAALNSNRAAYSNLRNEQARNSPEGQKLLKTIQDQDKAFKDLSRSMGDNKQLVGGYRSELQELVEKFGSVNPELREANEKFNLLKGLGEAAFSPLGLTIAGVAVALGITTKALDVFYEDSIQGQDALNRSFTTWQALLLVIKDTFFDFGKAISENGFLGKAVTLFSQFVAYATKGVSGLVELAEKNEKVNATVEQSIAVKREEIALTVELSELTLEKEDELFVARDKAGHQLSERYEALQKGRALGKEIMDERINQVNNEIKLQQLEISQETARSVVGMTANQILKEANSLGLVNYAQVKKLADLEAQRNQIQSDRLKGSRRNQALEFSMIEEAIKMVDTQKKAELDSYVKGNDEIIKQDMAFQASLISDQRTSFQVKIAAIDQNIANEAVLNDNERVVAIQSEKEKYASLVTLTKEQHAEIDRLAGEDLNLKAAMERSYKLQAVESDKSFNTVRNNIESEYQTKEQTIINKGNREKIKLGKEYAKAILEIELQIGEAFLESSKEITANVFEGQQEELQGRIDRLEAYYQDEEKLAGDNAQAKLAIDKKHTEDQKKLQDELSKQKEKAAIFDKAATLLQIALKEAFAIAELLPYLDNPFTAAWAGVQLAKTITLATLQEAAVASKPIPHYKYGTQDHGGGLAVIGDGGQSELYATPQGVVGLSPSRSTLIDLPEGSKVFTGNMTTRLLAMMGLGIPERLDKVQQFDNNVYRELQKTNRLLAQPQSVTSIASDGVAIVISYKNAEAQVMRIRKNVMPGL